MSDSSYCAAAPVSDGPAYNRKSGGNLWKQWSQLFINIEVASQTTLTGLRYASIVIRKNMKKMKLKSMIFSFFRRKITKITEITFVNFQVIEIWIFLLF